MPKNKKNKDEDFVPPKLPFAWLASTFILPLTVLIVPDLISKDGIPFMTKAVIALSILAIFLFISCLILLLSLYDFSFRLQVIKLKLDDDTKLLEVAEAQGEEIRILREQLKEAKSAKDPH